MGFARENKLIHPVAGFQTASKPKGKNMNPDKVQRSKLNTLIDLPNVGKAVAEDLVLLGITQPQDLAGQDAYEMYSRLCSLTATRHDPCMIDIFLSLVDFMQGNEPKPWWHFTEQRKAFLADK
ncbi:pathogenicity locus [Neisseria sicca VK64]|uniref:Pathogenicity locus n=2 Tax=Neisseria sicca TaxID=490 RepID=I2NXB7_NEISI|nr:pathogenicity locus [Neisseria sicca VK64]